MSVRSGLLALLSDQSMYGARLRAEFESRTGGTWPLNVGQVYTTLDRLERDGLVDSTGVDPEGRQLYALTDEGRVEAAGWWRTPVTRESTPRDELVIKLALAVTLPDVDVQRVVQTQRTATMRHLRDLTRLKARSADPSEPAELAWTLVLENHLFAAAAEARWLDHVESALSRHSRRPPRPADPAADTDALPQAAADSFTGGDRR